MAVERRAAEERVVGQLLVEITLVERFANKKKTALERAIASKTQINKK